MSTSKHSSKKISAMNRAHVTIMKIPASERNEFLAQELQNLNALGKVKITPMLKFAECPVCSKPYDTRQDGRTFRHYYDDDYGSMRFTECVDRSQPVRGIIYSVTRIPIY